MSDRPIEGNALQAGAFRSAAATHPGTRRKHNEDAWLNRPDLGLWAVADGAGGHHAGDVAARATIAALDAIPAGLSGAELLAQVRLRLAGVHTALRGEAAKLAEGTVMAATVVALIVRGDHFACLWAGDSRAYRVPGSQRASALGPGRGENLEQLTRDHSLVQEMVEAGALAAAEAQSHPQANIITRALGAGQEVLELDKVIGQMLPGDRFLLCSDGVCKTLDDAQLARLLAEGADAEQVLAAALAREASDNVTVVLVRQE